MAINSDTYTLEKLSELLQKSNRIIDDNMITAIINSIDQFVSDENLPY